MEPAQQAAVYEFLTFRRMLTPLIIQIIFWVGAGLSVITGLGMIIVGLQQSFGGTMMVFSGLLQMVLGPVLVRIWCELIIIFFRMNESLLEIRKKTA